jgi:U3 small nucleolar RNA-associated protein 4
VHRCRFVDFTPAAITALAFPPLQPPSALLSAKQKDKGKAKSSQDYSIAKYGTLAVGRANGNIELCEWTGKDGEKEARQAWVVRKVSFVTLLCETCTKKIQTFSGPYPSKVDSLAFAIRFPNPASAGNVPTLSDLRLFSAGGGSELLEWDLGRSCIKASALINACLQTSTQQPLMLLSAYHQFPGWCHLVLCSQSSVDTPCFRL